MNSYGLVFGGEKTSHDSGNDITYQVVTGNNYSQVVIEGDEYILPKEVMQSEKVYDFVDKLPIEMLDEIKRSENVFIQFPNLRHGDMVVCKNSVRNDDLHTIKGTAKEIANYLQGLSACRMYAKGGYISGELANGGGVEDESQLRLLTPMPPTKLGKTGIDSLTEIVGKEIKRPFFSGALYAGKGRIVATDAHILVVLENQNYPKSLDGTIKSLWNKVPQERLVGISYPNWEGVVPNQQIFQTKELSIDDVLAYAYGGFLEGKNIIKEKDFNKYQKEIFKYVLRLNIGNIEIGIDSLLLTRILRTLKANDVRKIVLHITGKDKVIKITTDNNHYGLIMPVTIPDKVEDLAEGIYVSQQIFYPISDKDFRAMSKKYGEYLTEFSKMVGGERMAEGGEITMNVPLLLRVLELAKEGVKEDKELHFIAERLQSLSKKGTLTMEDYDYISGLESNDKIQKLIAENDSNDSDLRFEQGGGIKKKSELLAPNGKPSNLTPEQWHLVRTPEFKAWFGDWEALENAKLRDRGMDEVTLKNLASNVSKVVDENGEPMVLYRGNEEQMGKYGFEFKLGLNLLKKPNKNDFGFFFTDDLEVAKKYRKVDLYDSYIAGSITPIFIKAVKVLDLSDFGDKVWQEEFVIGLEEKGIKFDSFEHLPNKIINYFDEGGSYVGWGNNTFDYFDVFPELRDLFLANKYEAVLFKEISRHYSPYNVFVAFHSNQIKLADGSNTTFDANNPDIRFEQGGMLENGVEGEYHSLYAFLLRHKKYIPIFAKKYGINESEWEDFVGGELGYDEEILQNILGDGYKLFYDEEKDMFEVSKKSEKKSGNYKIERISSKNEKQVLRIISDQILTELKPRLAVFWNDTIVGGSTYEFKNGTYKFDLAILPDYQGLGISKGLIQSIIDDAKMLKAKSLEAEVVNKKLLSYLKSIGFSAYKSQGQDFVFLSLK